MVHFIKRVFSTHFAEGNSCFMWLKRLKEHERKASIQFFDSTIHTINLFFKTTTGYIFDTMQSWTVGVTGKHDVEDITLKKTPNDSISGASLSNINVPKQMDNSLPF